MDINEPFPIKKYFKRENSEEINIPIPENINYKTNSLPYVKVGENTESVLFRLFKKRKRPDVNFVDS